MKKPMYLPYDKNIVSNAQKLRNNMTEEEKKIWYQYLCNYPLRFTRQKSIDRYILDFYCARCRLGIELDGNQHLTKQGIGHDEARTKLLNAYGIIVIRFTNERVRYDYANVCREIDLKVQELIQQPKI